ncbi:MAG: CheY-like chemotaxis protein [Myxococcota bacterium]|jgi:CheY-like chemotaxis protein
MPDEKSNALAEEIARGLAHNVNNVLASIIGNISVARASLPSGDPIRSRLDAAERASFRLQDLTERLQLYARRIEPILEPVAVERIISEAVSRVGVDVVRDVESGLTVACDAPLMIRAVQELLENAREAGGVSVSITARRIGDDAEIAVVDRGHGLEPEFVKTMFDPFTTTRARGRGLGLPIVAAMMRIHNGEVNYSAVSGGGSKFRLWVPSVSLEPQEAAGAGARVLVVDDEEALRDVLGDMLRLLGHEVTIAGDGSEALEHFKRARLNDRPFTLVVLDLMIPGGLGGADILSQMRADIPDLKAIVSSGYWAEATGLLGAKGFQAALIKPFTMSDVKSVVEQVLSGAKGR